MIDHLNVKDIDLKLDIEAGRKIIQRMSRMEGFNVMVQALVTAYFAHHLTDHLKLDIPELSLDGNKPPSHATVLKYADKYQSEYEDVQNIINRQILMLASVFASAELNTQNDGERAALNCKAFDIFVTVPAISWIIGDNIMTDLNDEIDKLKSQHDAVAIAHRLSARTSGVTDMIHEALTKFCALALIKSYR